MFDKTPPEFDAAIKAAKENLARIREEVARRPDATVGSDFSTEMSDFPSMMHSALGMPEELSLEQLCIKAGSSSLRITVCMDYYLISGTDNGIDWAPPQPNPPLPGATVTVDVGGGQDAIVSADWANRLLSKSMNTSYPYDEVMDGRDRHERLHDYVDNWIKAHTRKNDGPTTGS